VINPILSFCSTQKSPISSQELSTPKETGEAVQVKQEPVPGAPVTPQEVEERKKVQCCKLLQNTDNCPRNGGWDKPRVEPVNRGWLI